MTLQNVDDLGLVRGLDASEQFGAAAGIRLLLGGQVVEFSEIFIEN